MQFSYVYILASRRNGTLYTGVTSDLEGRIWQHKHEITPGFARKHDCKLLVWFETHNDIAEAIRREKQIKRWHREWKLRLIEERNPQWRDLWLDIFKAPEVSILPEARELNLSRLTHTS
jgi:putative endonuclease